MLRFLPAAIASDVLAYLRRTLHQERGHRVRAKMDRKPRLLEAPVPSLPPSQRGTMGAAEIVKCGQEVYERRWRESLEQTARGRFVAINILTEEYVLGEPGDTEFGAGRAFRARWPDESVPCLVIAIGVPLAA